MPGKLVIVCTTGPDDPEKATLSFVMATGAQASDVEVVMIFQGDGVTLVEKDAVGLTQADNFPPLAELREAFFEMDGIALICGPCAKTRGINQDNIVETARIVSAAAQMAEIMSATSVLNY
jgi:predicted peroxiredoxin